MKSGSIHPERKFFWYKYFHYTPWCACAFWLPEYHTHSSISRRRPSIWSRVREEIHLFPFDFGAWERRVICLHSSPMYTLTKSRTEWKFSISCQPFFALFFPIDLVSLFWWIRCWCCLACACFGATGASTVFRKQSFCCYCWCCCCCVCEWVFFFSRSLTRSIPFSSLCRGSGCLFYARLVPLVFLCM